MKKATVPPRRVVTEVRRIGLEPSPEVSEPVLDDDHKPDDNFIKKRFEELSKAHKNVFLDIAISYMAAKSAMDEVSSDLKQVVAPDFHLDDSSTALVDDATDRAIAYYMNRHFLTLATAPDVDVSSICSAMFDSKSAPSPQPRLTARDIVEALGLTARQAAPATDPYASRPRKDEE